MNIAEQNEVLEITRLLYSLPDIELCNALRDIQDLYDSLSLLKQAKAENKIVFSGYDRVQ